MSNIRINLTIIFIILIILTACGRKVNQNNKTASGNTVKQEQAGSNQELGGVKEAGLKTYAHPGYGFSFEYPAGWNISSFAEGEGETVLLQNVIASGASAERGNLTDENNNQNNNKKSLGEKQDVREIASSTSSPRNDKLGIQIYISMFDEPETVLTKERILKDIPEMKIENEQAIKIGGAVDGLKFDSANEAGEKTKEVWFVHENFLYQVTATAGSGDVLDKIISSWIFR